jgi:hypothetical protein
MLYRVTHAVKLIRKVTLKLSNGLAFSKAFTVLLRMRWELGLEGFIFLAGG